MTGAGLMRCGKSCRLRWLNYLRPDIKRGNISDDEEDLIIRLHKLLGNRYAFVLLFCLNAVRARSFLVITNGLIISEILVTDGL